MISPFTKLPHEYLISHKSSNHFKPYKNNTKLPKLKKLGGKFHQKILNSEQSILANALPNLLRSSKSIEPSRSNDGNKQTIDPSIESSERNQNKAQDDFRMKNHSKFHLQTQIDTGEAQIIKNLKLKNQQQCQALIKPNEIIQTDQNLSGCSSKQLRDFFDEDIDMQDFQKQIQANRRIIKKQTENRRKEISQYIQQNQSYQKQIRINQSHQYSHRHKFSKYRKELKQNKMFLCLEQQSQKKKIYIPKIKQNNQKFRQQNTGKKSSMKRLNSPIPSVAIPSLILKRQKSSLVSDQNLNERKQPINKLIRHNSEQFQMKKVKSLVGFKQHIIILQNKYREIEKKEAEKNNYYNIKKSLSSQQQHIQSEEILKSPQNQRKKLISPLQPQSDVNNQIQVYNKKFTKNEQCLEDYISTRKMLMQLEIQQRYNQIYRNSIRKSLSRQVVN